jgi:hypothetical protein
MFVSAVVQAIIFHAAVLTNSAVCTAQGLRISTHIYDISNSAGRTPSQIVSSSLSLIHNGRVYDYVQSADEVVIFDPVEKRFTILSDSRKLSTRITFDEIRHLMDSRGPKTREYVDELLASGTPSAKQIAASIQFQLDPKFSQTFDNMRGTLVLSSPSFTYRVETRKWNDPEQVERYLMYADWTAQLNSILHPGSLFPEPRMALNKALRELKDRMPVSVELDRRPGEQLRLRAEHQLTQKVSDDDHQRIARWEESLNSGALKDVSFRSYQQAALVSQTR